MKLRVRLIWFCAILCAGAGISGAECEDSVKHSTDGILGFGLELILSKLEMIEDKLEKTDDKLQNIEKELKEHRVDQRQIAAALNELRSSQTESRNEIFVAFQKLEHHVALNVTGLQKRNHEEVEGALHKLDQDVERVLKKQESQQSFFSCRDAPSNVSETYLIGLNNVGVSVPFRVYCEQEAFGGGWIVIQYRYDGSLDFYRGWNEFRDGFGDLNKEFWLGLEKVHQLTKARKHELIVELKDFSGDYAYARYDAFKIDSEDEGYALKELSKHSGTVDNSMSFNKNEKFSTKDRDNDKQGTRHLAKYHVGAWWHFQLTHSNLNGRYMNEVSDKSMYWYSFKELQGLKYSRMMIREVE
ncbi:ficolin-3-like [Anopheles albimanus]|uniref:ficolin-3-like n=1 Tax=Anopheles albimanus TaxID=7167 RepID=UPI00163F1032|nr:ficolin-3-like [Anopheles albimanus]